MAGSNPTPYLLVGALALAALTFAFLYLDSGEAKAWHNIVSIEPYTEAVTFVGAGDIASCDSFGDELTAALLDSIPGTVFTLGDNIYSGGSLENFEKCYGPSWGRHKARTMPSIGNHDYDAPGPAGYFAYFGDNAGSPENGYYSYNVGKWHAIVLNSNCDKVPCAEGSPQEKWLREDLASNMRQCTLAYMHHPPFSSGSEGMKAQLRPIWKALSDGGVDIVLASHDHFYERLAPLGLDGSPDYNSGTRVFVVGTGGVDHRPIVKVVLGSEVRNAATYGVLRLTLRPGGYGWEFIPAEGNGFTDMGSGKCR